MAEKEKKAADEEPKAKKPAAKESAAKKEESPKKAASKEASAPKKATSKKTADAKKATSKKTADAKKESPAKKQGEEKKETSAKKPAAKKEAAKPAAKPAAKDKPKAKGDEEPEAEEEPTSDEEDVTIVEEGEEAPAHEHKARLKPELDEKTRELLAKREQEDRRRPAFRRQQWYMYKRLERSGWRHPTGQDSAQRRRFGYRPTVVKVGFRGPKAVRGLHPSGFEEVRVETLGDLDKIDPKSQAARVAAKLGKRKLADIYEAADEKKIRILNRRDI